MYATKSVHAENLYILNVFGTSLRWPTISITPGDQFIFVAMCTMLSVNNTQGPTAFTLVYYRLL